MEKILFAFPIFALLILLEYAYGLKRKRNTYSDLKDAAASISLGIAHVCLSLLLASVLLKIDSFIYEHRIFTFGNNWYILLLLF